MGMFADPGMMGINQGMPGMPGGYTPPGGAMPGMPGMDPADFGALMAETGGAAANPGFDYAAHLAATGGYTPPGGAMPGYAGPAAGGYGDPYAPAGYGDPMAGAYGGPMAGGYGDPMMDMGPGMMAGGYGDPMMGGDFFMDPGMGMFVDPGMMAGGYGDPMYNDPMYNDPAAPANAYAPPALTFTASEIIGTSSPDDISARNSGDILTGAEMGDMLYSSGFSNVVFNYNSFDLGSLTNEAFGDKINYGWMDFGNPSQATSGINVGLGNTDKLKFENITLKYGNTNLNVPNGNEVISLNSADNKFTGDGSGGGVLGDVCLFDAGNLGGMSGNIVFGIDADGNGSANNDIFFDVDDSITQATYDATSDAFTFS
jgi:hypothetical protein